MYYDTVCQFSCNDGYIGTGSQARRCQHNGTWSGQDFTCQSMLPNSAIVAQDLTSMTLARASFCTSIKLMCEIESCGARMSDNE